MYFLIRCNYYCLSYLACHRVVTDHFDDGHAHVTPNAERDEEAERGQQGGRVSFWDITTRTLGLEHFTPARVRVATLTGRYLTTFDD